MVMSPNKRAQKPILMKNVKNANPDNKVHITLRITIQQLIFFTEFLY